MKFALQLAAIIVAVLVAHYLPAPDPENFAAVEMPSAQTILLLAILAVQIGVAFGGRIASASGSVWQRWKSLFPAEGSGLIRSILVTAAIVFVAGFAVGTYFARAPLPPSPPTPVVDPVVVTPGLRVIIGRETGDKPTREQDLIYGSTAITAYLNEKCVKVDGRPGWRKWDDDDPKSEDNADLAKLWEATKKEVPPPFIVIANEKRTVVSPLPATEAATLELLKKHGG